MLPRPGQALVLKTREPSRLTACSDVGKHTHTHSTVLHCQFKPDSNAAKTHQATEHHTHHRQSHTCVMLPSTHPTTDATTAAAAAAAPAAVILLLLLLRHHERRRDGKRAAGCVQQLLQLPDDLIKSRSLLWVCGPAALSEALVVGPGPGRELRALLLPVHPVCGARGGARAREQRSRQAGKQVGRKAGSVRQRTATSV